MKPKLNKRGAPAKEKAAASKVKSKTDKKEPDYPISSRVSQARLGDLVLKFAHVSGFSTADAATVFTMTKELDTTKGEDRKALMRELGAIYTRNQKALFTNTIIQNNVII